MRDEGGGEGRELLRDTELEKTEKHIAAEGIQFSRLELR